MPELHGSCAASPIDPTIDHKRSADPFLEHLHERRVDPWGEPTVEESMDRPSVAVIFNNGGNIQPCGQVDTDPKPVLALVGPKKDVPGREDVTADLHPHAEDVLLGRAHAQLLLGLIAEPIDELV